MEGDTIVVPLTSKLKISIHSLRMEGDVEETRPVFPRDIFQSTPSAWRETANAMGIGNAAASISIHSLRMEGDHGQTLQLTL